MGATTFRSEKAAGRALDDVDWRLLDLLQADGRLSFKELGRRINLSAPAVAERVRRLELRSSVVLSTQYEGRPVQRPSDDFLRATKADGWS
jgi:hypothetical protein